MRKALSVLMILILLGLFASTYANSVRTEKFYRAQLQQLNQLYAGFLSAELIDYHRGLLVSEVKTNFTIQDEIIPLQHQVRHFPWMVRIETRLAENSAVAKRLAAVIGSDQLILQTEVQLNGSSQTNFELAELALVEDRLKLLVKGVSVFAELDSQLSGRLVMQLEKLELAEQGKLEILLSDILLDSEFIDQQGLPLGTGAASIGKLVVIPQDKASFELNQLSYAVETGLENDKLTTSVVLNFANLLLGGESFTSGELDLLVADVDAEVIREIQAAGQQVQAELANKQVDPLVLQLQLLSFYSQLLQEGLSISMNNLSLHTDGGRLQGSGQLKLQGHDLLAGGLASLGNLEGQLHVTIDKAIFNAGFRMLDNLQRPDRKSSPAVQNELAEQLAGGLIQKGIFTLHDAGHYQLEFSLQNGEGNLNGASFQL